MNINDDPAMSLATFYGGLVLVGVLFLMVAVDAVYRWYKREKALDDYLSFITARTLLWMEQQRKDKE